MAKSPLFHRIRRLVRMAHQADRHGLPPREIEMAVADPGRRAFLRKVLLGAAGLTVANSLRPLNALARATPPLRVAGEANGLSPVVILGGGAAGLTAAYTLGKAGLPYKIYEAAPRVGGRIFTERNLNPDGQFFERGAELVDSDHATLIRLAGELGLKIEDFSDEPHARDYVAELYYVDGRLRSEHEFVAGVRPLLATIVQANREMFGDEKPDLSCYARHNAAFHRYDRMSAQEFMAAQTGVDPWVKKVVEIAFVSEYGREFAEQSSLNVITLIGTDPDHFNMFGESDESKRVHGGNDSLTLALKHAITGGKSDEEQTAIAYRHALVALHEQGGVFTCTFRGPEGTVAVRTSQLICTVPFPVLREVDGVRDLELSHQNRQAVADYQFGLNSKVVNSFRHRVWRHAGSGHPAFSGAVYADTEAQNFWEASRLQPGERGLLTALLGGRDGLAADNRNIERNVALYEAIFPGVAAAYEGIGETMNWNKMPFARGSYTCMGPGQYAQFFGSASRPEYNGKLLFAGEHVSLNFTGFMNGAYETGEAAALAIIGAAKSARAA